MLIEQANREVYSLLKEGILVGVSGFRTQAKRRRSIQRRRAAADSSQARVRVVDWENPAANVFCWSANFSVHWGRFTLADQTWWGLSNGLPNGVIELKKPGVPARAAFVENLTHYSGKNPVAALV